MLDDMKSRDEIETTVRLKIIETTDHLKAKGLEVPDQTTLGFDTGDACRPDSGVSQNPPAPQPKSSTRRPIILAARNCARRQSSRSPSRSQARIRGSIAMHARIGIKIAAALGRLAQIDQAAIQAFPDRQLRCIPYLAIPTTTLATTAQITNRCHRRP